MSELEVDAVKLRRLTRIAYVVSPLGVAFGVATAIHSHVLALRLIGGIQALALAVVTFVTWVVSDK